MKLHGCGTEQKATPACHPAEMLRAHAGGMLPQAAGIPERHLFVTVQLLGSLWLSPGAGKHSSCGLDTGECRVVGTGMLLLLLQSRTGPLTLLYITERQPRWGNSLCRNTVSRFPLWASRFQPCALDPFTKAESRAEGGSAFLD